MSATNTLTLTEFLLERIAEDEVVAREAPTDTPPHDRAMEYFYPDDRIGIDPARVLAVSEAHRRIVEEHAPGDVDPCTSADHMGHLSPASECPVFRALAAIYTDHEDYRDEWRP